MLIIPTVVPLASFTRMSSSFLFFSCLLATLSYVSSEKFGCPFINDGYELPSTSKSIDAPVYGDINLIEPLQFDFISNTYEKQFETFLKDLSQLNRKIIQEKAINNVDGFFRLIQQFDNAHLIPNYFEKFFKTYRPKFDRDHEDIADQSVEVLERIIESNLEEKYKGISKSIYLSGTRYIQRDKLKSLLKNRKKSEPKVKRYTYFTATIKISVKRYVCETLKSKEKVCKTKDVIGYVLMKPGLSWTTPIVVMEDGIAPHSNSVLIPVQQKQYIMEFALHNADYVYTLADARDNVTTYFTFVGRPYCSIIDTTIKENLLNNFKYIVKRDMNGQLAASFKFKLFQDRKNPQIFWDYISDTRKYTSGELFLSNLKNLSQNDEENKMNVLEPVGKSLGLSAPNDTLASKVSALKAFYGNFDSEVILEMMNNIKKSHYNYF